MVTRRDALIRRRAAMGFSQESLAEHLNMDRCTIGRWERGTMAPQPWTQPRLAQALDVSLEKLANLLDPGPTAQPAQPDWHHPEPTGVLEASWSIAGTMRVLHEMAGGPMDRRGFLTITGAALTGVANQWGHTVNRPPTLPEAHQPRLTPELLDQLDNRLADLRHLDDTLGGGELTHLAGAEFRWLTHLADNAADNGGTGQRLFTLISEAARLCGWLHFDAGQHAAAQSYYVTALRASATAKDTTTGANVLGWMSLQAGATGHPNEAIALVEAAEQRTKHSATPRLRALLASRKAWAYATARDAAACARTLKEVERHLDKATTGTWEPDWIYWFDEATVAAQAAHVWVDLHQPAKARPLIDNALSSMDPHYVRDRAFFYARSARAHMHAAELEPACDDLSTAADLARRTGSIRVLDTIREARGSMSRYNGEARVKELDCHLAELTG